MDYTPANIIKVIFGIHFALISLGIQGYWSPDSYFFYNLIFLLTILWSIHNNDKVEPVQIAIGINVLSVFLDIITLAGYFPTTNRHGGEKFSASMAIINLLVRPLSTFYLIRNCNQRMGLDSDNFSNIFYGPLQWLSFTFTSLGFMIYNALYFHSCVFFMFFAVILAGGSTPGPSGRNTYEDIGN